MAKITRISKEEEKSIKNSADAAEELLTDERFAFIIDYFNSTKKYIENTIIENTVHEVREVVTISEKLSKIFITPKKVQVDELSGQHKLIKKFFNDLNYYIQTKKDLESEIKAGRVKIDE